MPYYIYILKSLTNGSYYIGHTNNIEKRLSQHNSPDYKGTKYTKSHKGPWICVYTEEFKTRSEAMKRENQIKAKKSRKYIEYLVATG